MSCYLVGDKTISAKEDRCTLQNNTDSRRLELELERIKRQQEIWLKEMSVEQRRLKLKLSAQPKRKTCSVSLPTSPVTKRTFSLEGKAPSRKQTFS